MLFYSVIMTNQKKKEEKGKKCILAFFSLKNCVKDKDMQELIIFNVFEFQSIMRNLLWRKVFVNVYIRNTIGSNDSD